MAGTARSTADKRCDFHALHQAGCFVIPNPCDAGSARWLQGLGFKALASTSSGFAWSLGRPNKRQADDTRACANFAAIGDCEAHDGLSHEAADLPVVQYPG